MSISKEYKLERLGGQLSDFSDEVHKAMKVEERANVKLRQEGFYMLNDLLRSLGRNLDPDGYSLGWIYSNDSDGILINVHCDYNVGLHRGYLCDSAMYLTFTIENLEPIANKWFEVCQVNQQ